MLSYHTWLICFIFWSVVSQALCMSRQNIHLERNNRNEGLQILYLLKAANTQSLTKIKIPWKFDIPSLIYLLLYWVFFGWHTSHERLNTIRKHKLSPLLDEAKGSFRKYSGGSSGVNSFFLPRSFNQT